MTEQSEGKSKLTATPPLPKNKAKASISVTNEMIKERHRRGKMNDYYKVLQSIVPNLFLKATKTKIIDETINYIEELEKFIAENEARKKMVELECDIPSNRQHTATVNMTVSNNAVFFGIRSKARRGLLSHVVGVFEKHKADILATNIASDCGWAMVTVVATINGVGDSSASELVISRIKNDLLIHLS